MALYEALLILAGVLAGGLLVWLVLGVARRSHRVSDAQLRDTFSALSAEALRTNNEAFLQQAQTALDARLREAEVDLEKRQKEIDHLVRPLSESLSKYEKELHEMEKRRVQAHGSLDAHLRELGKAQSSLQKETTTLATALRNPQVRGRWGELTLGRVVELAGMQEHCDFSTQASVTDGDGGRLRPDMIVRLPGGRRVVIDAKAPLDAYLDHVAAPTEHERDVALRAHADKIKAHMRALSAKSYWAQFKDSPEFVVMFIPGEAFFAAALEAEPGLIEEGARSNIILATPTTLISLFKAVAHGWRQEQIAEHAEMVRDLGVELHDRLRVMAGHLAKVGDHLGRTVRSYNDVIGSYESRVLVTGRKFAELGAASGSEIEPLAVVEAAPRAVPGGEPAGGDGEAPHQDG